MQDELFDRQTVIAGSRLPSGGERVELQDDHRRRLEALDRLCAAAAECGIATDPDRDLVTLPEDVVSLLELGDPAWARLGGAIRDWRAWVPLRTLEDFGFPADADSPLEEASEALRRIGGGVEAWAFASVRDGSVYKFYQPREGGFIGSAFEFRHGDETFVHAEARLGSYRELLEKLELIQALGGMPTEVVGVTAKEGILVAKQTLGVPLPQGDDMSGLLPRGLIEIPSRYLRANRDHPRLFFLRDRAFLIGDLHARNFVRGADGGLHLIDLVAAAWPGPLLPEWIERVRGNPDASALPDSPDDQL